MSDYTTMKQWLLDRQQELTERIAKIKTDASRKNSADWSEQAQERQNDEVIDALGNEAQKELNKITVALKRIDYGDYGLCSECGKLIAPERLKAMPYCDRCIRCADTP
ncbi:General stress protein 16O [invertebrate metagenome]|uniref:General stress protein 16O n=1 Tax=invertebrate metagenome TaxID=1711999 RepID=A0A2H9TAM2_9ZZZZ